MRAQRIALMLDSVMHLRAPAMTSAWTMAIVAEHAKEEEGGNIAVAITS